MGHLTPEQKQDIINHIEAAADSLDLAASAAGYSTELGRELQGFYERVNDLAEEL